MARTRCVPSAFGPNRRSRSAASADESPSGPLPSRESTSPGGQAGGVGQIQLPERGVRGHDHGQQLRRPELTVARAIGHTQALRWLALANGRCVGLPGNHFTAMAAPQFETAVTDFLRPG